MSSSVIIVPFDNSIKSERRLLWYYWDGNKYIFLNIWDENEVPISNFFHNFFLILQAVNAELEKLLEEERLMRRDEELVRSAQARFIADELDVEAGAIEAERVQRQLAQVKLEKEMEISDTLLKGQ